MQSGKIEHNGYGAAGVKAGVTLGIRCRPGRQAARGSNASPGPDHRPSLFLFNKLAPLLSPAGLLTVILMMRSTMTCLAGSRWLAPEIHPSARPSLASDIITLPRSGCASRFHRLPTYFGLQLCIWMGPSLTSGSSPLLLACVIPPVCKLA